MLNHISKPARRGLSLATACFAITQSNTGCKDKNAATQHEIPKEFTAQADLFSSGAKVALKGENGKFAQIQRTGTNPKVNFVYLDGQDKLQAQATLETVRLQINITINDQNGSKLGTIEGTRTPKLKSEHPANRGLSYCFTIKNYDDDIVAIGSYGQYSRSESNTAQFYGKSKTCVAEFSSPTSDFGGDTWTCNISSLPGFDKRLILFYPAIQTYLNQVNK